MSKGNLFNETSKPIQGGFRADNLRLLMTCFKPLSLPGAFGLMMEDQMETQTQDEMEAGVMLFGVHNG